MSRRPLVRPALFTGFGVCAALLLSALPGVSSEAPAKKDAKAETEERALTASLKKATVDGKYQMLLRQIKVADDKDNYGDFSDYGPYAGTDYANSNSGSGPFGMYQRLAGIKDGQVVGEF